MEIKLSKEGLNKTRVILLLLSGLVFHDFLAVPEFKIGVITITYLRVMLIVCIPLLIFLYKIRIYKNDYLAYGFILFMLYGLTRIEGNFKEAFSLYCPLVAFLILYISIHGKELLDKCIDFLSSMLVVFCFLGLFEIVTGIHFVETHLELVNDNRVVACGMYFNENDFSAFLSVLIVYMIQSSFKKYTKVFFVVFAFVIVCINRSVICIIGLVSFLLVIFILKSKHNRMFRLVGVALLLFITIKPVIDLINSTSFWWRSYMYSFGIKNVISHMLIGTGIGKYSDGMINVGYDLSYRGASADPHNLFYELAGTFGIVWAILLIVYLIKLMFWNLNRVSNNENLYVFGLVYIIPFVGLASSSCMEKNYIYLALLIPAIYYRLYTCNDETVIRIKKHFVISKK